jgi:peptide/nickel transport system permease protein
MAVTGAKSAQRRGLAGAAAPVRLLAGILRVLSSLALTFIGLTAITFLIGRVMPLDPVLAIVGDRAPQDVYNAVYRQLGLDQPIYVQYLRYPGDILSGEFGISIQTARPVLDDLMHFFPATLELATLATLIGTLLGVPMGVLAAVKRGRIVDHAVRVLGLVGYSMPVFWLGMVALLVFYARLRWVPGPCRLVVFYEWLVPPVSGLLLVDSALAGDWTVF